MAIQRFENESYIAAKEVMDALKEAYENPRSRMVNKINYADLAFLSNIMPNKAINLGNCYYYLTFMDEPVFVQITNPMSVAMYSYEEFQKRVAELDDFVENMLMLFDSINADMRKSECN